MKKVFTVLDGVEPKQSKSGSWKLCLPLSVTLRSGESTMMNLGVICSRATTLFPPKHLLGTVTTQMTIDGDEQIFVSLMNASKDELLLEAGDHILSAIVH